MGTIAIFPILLGVAIWIYKDSPGPVIFKHTRIGKDGNPFPCYKFRSMCVDAKEKLAELLEKDPEARAEWERDFKLKNDPRITKSGAFLRKTSLDELPQIWDIFVGNMSIIGPRPALWNQDDLVAERDKYGANDVRPGLTGWAQINGRDELEIPVKAKLDGEYVEKISFGFDCKCFFGTIFSVLKHDGVVEGGTGELHKQEEKVSK